MSSGLLSSSTSCSDNSSRISPASTRKSWRISSSASKLIFTSPKSPGLKADHRHRPGRKRRLHAYRHASADLPPWKALFLVFYFPALRASPRGHDVFLPPDRPDRTSVVKGNGVYVRVRIGWLRL